MKPIPKDAVIEGEPLQPGETIDGGEPIPEGATIDGLRPGETIDSAPSGQPGPESTITAPSIAGHMPGIFDFGNKVTPAQAAGGIAAGAAVGSAPLLAGAGSAGVAMLEAAALKHPFIAHIVKEGIRAVGISGGVGAVRKMFAEK